MALPNPVNCTAEDATLHKKYALAQQAPQNNLTAMYHRADQLWDTLSETFIKRDLSAMKMPGKRTLGWDWVRLGLKLKQSDVAFLRDHVRAVESELLPYPEGLFEGRGVVTIGGGLKYLVPAWVMINMLRRSGSTLPVEMWFPVNELPPLDVESALTQLGVTCRRLDQRSLGQSGYSIKAAVLLLTRFREVLFLDADNVPLRDPTPLFTAPQYLSSGALLWKDFWDNYAAPQVSEVLELRPPGLPPDSFESGQMLIDKKTHWRGLQMAVFFNLWGRVWWSLLTSVLGYGDKDTFAAAISAVGGTYHLVSQPPSSSGSFRQYCWHMQRPPCRSLFVGNTMVQHDTNASFMFMHANLFKFATDIPDNFSDYQRRWTHTLPNNLDFKEWSVTHLGCDIEAEVYLSLRCLQCAPWWPAALRTRLRLGDAALPVLSGFHHLNPGFEFIKFYRTGWTGSYERLMRPSLTDWMVHHYYRLVLPRIRRLQLVWRRCK